MVTVHPTLLFHVVIGLASEGTESHRLTVVPGSQTVVPLTLFHTSGEQLESVIAKVWLIDHGLPVFVPVRTKLPIHICVPSVQA